MNLDSVAAGASEPPPDAASPRETHEEDKDWWKEEKGTEEDHAPEEGSFGSGLYFSHRSADTVAQLSITGLVFSRFRRRKRRP